MILSCTAANNTRKHSEQITRNIIIITILLHFHYSISLETASTQKSELFLLRISLENVNALVVT